MDINATLFGQMITFAIFVWFTMKIVWPMLEEQLNERKKKIADGLSAAEKGKEILRVAESSAKESITRTKERCNHILHEANKQAEQILEQAETQAQQEKEDILQSGYKQIELAVNQAKNELQKQLAGLVVLGAEKILGRSISSHDHEKMLADLAKKVL